MALDGRGSRLDAAGRRSPIPRPPAHARLLRFCLLGLLAGCAAPAPAPGPDEAIRAYAGALERGDLAAAAGWVESTVRTGRSHEGVARTLQAQPGEALREARRLVAAAARPAALSTLAVVELGEGRAVVLRHDGDRWLIVSGSP